MKLYNYYRLVKTNTTGKVITDDELETILREQNYSVPEIARVPRFTPPPAPDGDRYSNPVEWAEWATAYKIAKAEYTALLTAQGEQERALGVWLANDFEMARLAVVGKDATGRNILAYVIAAPADTKYTFLQAARRLTGVNRPADCIEFICHGRLG